MAYFLSDSDLNTLNALLAWWRKSVNNPRFNNQVNYSEIDRHQTAEIYVAKTPSGGMPACTGLTTPGSAICDIYTIDFTSGDPTTPTLVALNDTDQRVYNVFPSAFGGGDLALIGKDKAGRWVILSGSAGDGAETPGSGTGPEDEPIAGGCNLAKLKTTDCIKVSTAGDDYYLSHDGTGWTSDKTLNWVGGTGVFRAEWNSSTGLLDLKLGGLRMMNCGNGCYTGGPLTGHDNGQSSGRCEGDVFTVCLSCHCCLDPLWDGDAYYCVNVSGTGTASNDCEPLYVPLALACDVLICSRPYADYNSAAAVCGDIVTACGTANRIVPWVITDKLGTCTCAPTSGTVVYNDATGNWETVTFACNPGDCEENATYDLQCVAGTWSYGGLTPTSASATTVVFDKNFGGGNSYKITFTIA